ncbi:MAG TPA: serine/threonine-protein kinase PknK, partial [Leptospiraceae bacterium]|nr:serine/threonine-protein kinase PknK [Leptospiraceae bacterium]
MKKSSDYIFQKLLFKGRNTDIYRGFEKNSEKKFIFKILSSDFPSEQEIRRLKKEYELTKKIQSNYVIRTEGFERQGNRYFILLEDVEGETLKTVFGKREPDVQHLLSVFSKISQGLYDIHSSGIIHKDINPQNIIYNNEKDIVKIIDFGISTDFIQESPNFRNPNRVEGTISYIAPEQTGRVNRNIDFRIDFYSLGVTFYELLTGSLPFSSDEPMEMFYAHIAKSPVSPEKMNSRIPSAVAEIVLKLLEKNPDDRYNTALGLKKDLDFCLRELKQNGTVLGFTAGKKDYSSTFKIRGRLYGRENELKVLEDAYRNSVSGRPELVLVSGYSGAGKTSIVNEMHRMITEKRGFFASGKFDQFQKNIPYYAFTRAFNSFCEYILTESPESIQNWKRKILNAVRNRGQVLVDFIPELELIIGKQPEVPLLNPSETQNRFNQVFYEFWNELDSPDHPLTLFIDDLQWSDLASLALLGKICSELQNGNFMIIGAYRDNEVDENHPLTRFIKDTKLSGIPVKEIKVNSLREEHISEMISESVSADAQKLQKLNRFVYEKAGGNPFFTIELLKKLFNDGIFYYNHDSDEWILNENELSRIQISENIVSLMFGKIIRLDESSKNALASASCLGNMFDLETFSVSVNLDISECSTRLVPAAKEGLIFPLDLSVEKSENALFKFSHDRIQQAAYSTIPEESRPTVHLQIGRNLLQKYSDREDRLFLITDHLNLGSSLIENETEIMRLIELNLLSAKKSKEAAAYDSALQYLKNNDPLLEKKDLRQNIWKKYYTTAYKYYILKGETEYLSGQLEESEKSISLAEKNAADILDRANAYQILIVQKTLLAEYENAISTGRTALSLFGIRLPDSDYEKFRDALLAEIDELTEGRTVGSLFDLPDMTDPEKRMAVNLLITMGPPCYRSHPRLWAVIVSTAVKLSIQYGNFPEAGYSHTAFGGMIGFVRGEYRRGKEFGELAERLMTEKFHSPAHRSVFFLMIGSSLRHWSFPLSQSSRDYQSAYDAGVESGNLQYAAYAFGHNMYCLFFQGMKLPDLRTEIEKYLKFSRIRKNWWAIDLLEGGLIIINYLMHGGDFSLDSMSENEYLQRCESHRNIQVVCIYNVMKTFALFILEKYSDAEKSFLEAEKRILSAAVQGLLPYSEHRFIQCLLILHRYRSASEEERKEYDRILDQNAELLKIWSENCPENYVFKYFLVLAEISRQKNDILTALNYYDKAVQFSEESGASIFQAVALELSAKFWNRQGRVRLSKPYMTEALYVYRMWGAEFKTSELRRKYEKSDRVTEREYSTYRFSDVFTEFRS